MKWWSVVLLTLSSTAAVAAQQSAPAKQAPVVSETIAIQVKLDRAGFSSGEIDGRPGSNVKRALEGFQKVNGVTVSGVADEVTWNKLRERGSDVPPLVSYTVTESDLAGPFQPDIPADLVQQAKLPALNYRDASEALAERFHASPALLKSLNPGATFSRPGEQVMVPNVEGATLPAASKVTINVSKSTSTLTVVDDTGTVIFLAPVTSGSEHDPLPIGDWKVNGVQRNPAFHYNPDLFWDARPGHSKATIQPGPNNPVGVVWIDLSKPHYGIHGTSEPSQIGHVQSHGCVRMTNWDAQKVAQWAKPGTPVVFRE